MPAEMWGEQGTRPGGWHNVADENDGLKELAPLTIPLDGSSSADERIESPAMPAEVRRGRGTRLGGRHVYRG